jgi:single-stranded-DNA-specific exonuclease
MRDGYGLSCRIIDEIKAGGAKLIITVDNGIRSIEEAKYAKSIGLDIIVTDHHTVGGSPDNIPDCLVINPIVAREKYPFRFLAGVGEVGILNQSAVSTPMLRAVPLTI